MSRSLQLVRPDGSLYSYTLPQSALILPQAGSFSSRIAFAAAHVVADPLRTEDPITKPAIDWDATLAYREYLWSLGFGVAEAMDTAQRGSGLHWPLALELIQRSSSAAAARKALVFSGAGTDHLPTGAAKTLQQVIDAYLQQCEAIESAGGRIVLMASRALAATARHAEDYALVYARVLQSARQPVILHWLGPMFDPALEGYWGSTEIAAAAETCLSVIQAHKERIDGIKISLLDADLEVSMRRRLPSGVRMYTGDDFNYAELIEGDEQGHSDALLGIFDGVAPAASVALQAFDAGDVDTFRSVIEPTVPLSRHIFRKPTHAYKTGIVFLAYLNGHQSHFRMLGGAESARTAVHLAELIRLADAAGLLADPELAASRARGVFAVAGIT